MGHIPMTLYSGSLQNLTRLKFGLSEWEYQRYRLFLLCALCVSMLNRVRPNPTGLSINTLQ